MSTQTEITRLQTARDTLRAKGVELGIVLSTDKLNAIADKFDTNMTNRGAVQAQVKEGETYTIPKGYHNGSGTVAGVSGGGNYTLQDKTVTPTKQQQNVMSDEGYYGLSGVTVAPIPAQYQDVSGTTASAGDVLANKVIVGADGALIAGTMPNNGAVSETLNVDNVDYAIPAGYHNGDGIVEIIIEQKTVTPAENAQEITPSTDKLLSKVSVAAIPAKYKDTTETDAVAANILSGKKAVTGAGLITGNMANKGAVTASIDGLTTMSYTIPAGYHNGSGAVALTGDIETALASI